VSISFTPIGSALDATIVGGNFDILENYLNERIVAGDIVDGGITHFIMRRYDHSRIESARSMSVEFSVNTTLPREERVNGEHEIVYRDPLGTAFGDTGTLHGVMMEYLGRPGPSFYWSFQEDGLVSPTAPPDVQRYDKEYCYSHWLTVPHASVRVFVPNGCVARISASAYYVGLVTAASEFIWNGPGIGAWDLAHAYKTEGRAGVIKFGLFVDENPGLSDEFANTNPHVLNPETGAMADYASWKKVTDKTSYLGAWSREDLKGDVILQGGKHYNFSLKWKFAQKLGYIIPGGSVFVDGFYELDNNTLANYNTAVYNYQKMVGVPPLELTWVSSYLDVEFIYGVKSITDDTNL